MHQSEASILKITLINRRNRSKWGRGGSRALDTHCYLKEILVSGVNGKYYSLFVLLRVVTCCTVRIPPDRTMLPTGTIPRLHEDGVTVGRACVHGLVSFCSFRNEEGSRHCNLQDGYLLGLRRGDGVVAVISCWLRGLLVDFFT